MSEVSVGASASVPGALALAGAGRAGAVVGGGISASNNAIAGAGEPPTKASPKARRVLGMDEGLPAAVVKDLMLEARRRERAIRKETRLQIVQQPTSAQRALPHPHQRVSEKALRFFGDDRLEEASRRVVTSAEQESARAHPKVARFFGEPALVASSPKGLHRLGSEMNMTQRRAQSRAAQAEQQWRKDEERRQLLETLSALPTEEQLRLPPKAAQQGISDKALRFFGEERLAEASRRLVTEDMRKNVNAKTLRIFGETDLLSDKERQLLGSLDLPQTSSSWLGALAAATAAFGAAWSRYSRF